MTADRPDLPILDQERLAILDEALGQAKLIELCEAARRSIIESAEELRRHWADDDRGEASRSAHRLAGVAANFGCSRLAELAAAIEKDCQNGGDGGRYRGEFNAVLTATLAALPGSA